MAHFAEIDENNIVLRVLVVHNSLEHKGEEFLSKDLGLGGRWIQTSYNNNIRGRYAGIGFKYDPILAVFIPPCPYPSWSFNSETLLWNAPIPKPTDDFEYNWNEQTQSWDKL